MTDFDRIEPDDDPSRFRVCARCGHRLYDTCVTLADETYCPDCLEELDIEDILRFCDCRSVGELLLQLGFEVRCD